MFEQNKPNARNNKNRYEIDENSMIMRDFIERSSDILIPSGSEMQSRVGSPPMLRAQ